MENEILYEHIQMMSAFKNILADIRSSMSIWAKPSALSQRTILWFVVINTALVNLASLALAFFEAAATGSSLLHIFSFHAALTIPMTAALLYRGAKSLQSSYAVKSELEAASEDLAARNAQLEQAHISLEQQANADFLTGLGNRRSFQIKLYNRHNTARVDGSPFWLAIIDLDNFKPVNDRHGHDAGDIVLKTIARRLRNELGTAKGAVISRLGGDEFAVIFDRTSVEDIYAAELLMNRLCNDLARPIKYKEHELCVAASAGMIEWQQDLTVSQMMHTADMALMDAKRSGKAHVRVVPPDTDNQKAIA